MSINSLPTLLGSLSVLIIGSFVLSNNPKSSINIAFTLFALSLFGWLFGYTLVYSANEPGFAMFGTRIACAFAAFTAPAFYHLVIAFLNKKNEERFVYFSYLVTFGFFVLFISTKYLLATPHKYSWGYYSHANTFHPLFLLAFFGMFLRGLYLLYINYLHRKEFAHEYASKSMYFFAAYLVALFGAVDYIQKYGVDVYPFGWLFEVAFALIIAYAITKHELMDIRVVIGRGLAYGIVGIVMIGSFAALFVFPLPKLVLFFLSAAFALIWAWAAHRLRAFIQTPIQEKWITDWYDSDKLINLIATRLIPVMDRGEAFKIISDELEASIKIKEIEIKLGQQENNYSDLTPTKAGLFLPLSSSGGLEGVLILGQKISEDPYSEKDLTIFKTIMIQARAIFDRIRPYEKIKADLEATERQLERSQRLASLGTLTAGVTHEIRNPLTVIRGEVETLFNQARDEEFKKHSQRVILESVDRIEAIIEGMLGIAREKTGQRDAAVDLNKIIEKSLECFPLDKITLAKELENIPAIKGDPGEIQEVFVNLIQNAVEAMPGGGTLNFRSYPEAGQVVVEVSDSGKGIPKDIREKIFDPFFSTRHEGVGLGLSIAYRIIREHGGDIQVTSEAGKGTTFKLIF